MRKKGRGIDRFIGVIAQANFFRILRLHANEPLMGSQLHQRRFVPPAMREAVV